ncbi:hypothetical protein I5P84_05640 [Pseudomonas mosselii]|uniref:hypothetical protein n=1 Tax=Pseudomonas mosselii TaxID=78327 RepID=UPI0018D6F174|nr:hypothetical protein [Pseudomonas mosselii]MBH3308937.1 hypothetical protein [Pseudomonas mosselii]MBH3325347.1 hypothetical protein [Pseudomonas mosselii]
MKKNTSNNKKPTKPKNDKLFDGKSLEEVYNYVHVSLTGEGDRGSVLLSGVFVDAILGSMLNKRLIPIPHKNCNNMNFSTKIDLAYQVALIDKDTFDLLHFLRDIRNTFAHHTPSSIHDDYISAVVEKLLNSQKHIHNNLIKVRMTGPDGREPSKRTQLNDLMTVIISLLYQKLLTTTSITGDAKL